MTGPHVLRRRRRVRWVVIGGSVLVVLAIGTAVAVTRLGDRQAAAAAPPDEVATAEVQRVDLAERETVSGELGYGTPRTLTGRRPGTVTKLPEQGAVLDRGAVVYEVDARPVVLFVGTLPLYRAVGPGMTDGPDVELVERNLRDLGYTGFGKPDEKFTAGTEAAVKRWQKKLGVDQTGVIELGDVVATSGPLRVDTLKVELGGEGTGPILEHTGTTRSVTVTVSADEKDLAPVGAKVTITINGQRIPGTVAAVTPAAADSGSQDPAADQSAKFDVIVSVDDLAAIGSLDSGAADVEVTTGARADVLAVPVGALLALAEGGYGVELASGKLLPVETGLFADGLVEVSGPGLAPGMKVVTTS